jgi:hypothetical protein
MILAGIMLTSYRRRPPEVNRYTIHEISCYSSTHDRGGPDRRNRDWESTVAQCSSAAAVIIDADQLARDVVRRANRLGARSRRSASVLNQAVKSTAMRRHGRLP